MKRFAKNLIIRKEEKRGYCCYAFLFFLGQVCGESDFFHKKANKFSIFLFTKRGNRGIIIGNISKEKLS